jgi:anti-sigma regulatory factor (Ser/Thr protein kinase)
MSTATVDHGCDGGRYRHEALFYSDFEGFVDGTLPFIRDSVAAGEPILVVLGRDKIDALRERLNGEAEAVLFADMAEVGANPARIIPAWQQFISDHAGGGRRLRGIGEPIWAGRSAAELAECQRHEALLNIAFADPELWLLCPYDTGSLEAAVIEAARRNHPFVTDAGVSRPSSSFAGAEQLAAPFDEPLPPPPADAVMQSIASAEGLRDMRTFVIRHAVEAGLSGLATSDLVFAANELAANSVKHGGGSGELYLWREGGAVVCEVRDRGRISDPLVGRTRPAADCINGRGLWMANQLCELVQIRSLAEGAVVRVHKRLD